MKCNLKGHQETQLCKNNTLLTRMSEEDINTQGITSNMNIIRDIMEQKSYSTTCETIQCNFCNSW